MRRTDVMLKLLGAPHQTELVTSALRLLQALLDRGAAVQVWACGDATGLTRADLGESKPRDVVDWSRNHPSTAAIVRDLLTGHPERLDWYVCRFCCQERGAADQLGEVQVRPAARFWEHVAATGTVVALGVV